MIDPHLAWFVIGASSSAVMLGWPWHPRFSRRRPYSSAAIAFCATKEDAARFRGKIINPLVQEDPPKPMTVEEWVRHRRGSNPPPPGCKPSPPSGPPPLELPRGTRSINFPDPEPGRQPTNPYTGKPVKPQFPPPREIPGDMP